MAGKDTVFDSKVKYNGVFSFRDFYKFCYSFVKEEMGMSNLAEKEYSEKIVGATKELTIKWEGSKKFTDYFKFTINIEFKIIGLVEVELNQSGQKIKTNKGDITIAVKGIYEKDYEGKYDGSPFKQFLRGVYEKFIITSSVKEYGDKIGASCDDFLTQAKAYLDLEGKK